MTQAPLIRLPVPVSLDALSDHLSAVEPAWRPDAPSHEAQDVTRGPYTLRVETWRYACGPLSLIISREAGDNGATHHMAWEAVFEASAALAGLDDGALCFEQTGWGAVALTHARAGGAHAQRLLDALIARLEARRAAP